MIDELSLNEVKEILDALQVVSRTRIGDQAAHVHVLESYLLVFGCVCVNESQANCVGEGEQQVSKDHRHFLGVFKSKVLRLDVLPFCMCCGQSSLPACLTAVQRTETHRRKEQTRSR